MRRLLYIGFLTFPVLGFAVTSSGPLTPEEQPSGDQGWASHTQWCCRTPTVRGRQR